MSKRIIFDYGANSYKNKVEIVELPPVAVPEAIREFYEMMARIMGVKTESLQPKTRKRGVL